MESCQRYGDLPKGKEVFLKAQKVRTRFSCWGSYPDARQENLKSEETLKWPRTQRDDQHKSSSVSILQIRLLASAVDRVSEDKNHGPVCQTGMWLDQINMMVKKCVL